MNYFYPLAENKDPETDPLMDQLPEGYTFAAKIFYPYVRMPKFPEAEKAAQSPNYPSDEDILRYGEPVSWEEIRRLTGLADVSEVSIAIVPRLIGFLKHCRKIYQRPDLVEKLEESLPENILYPDEDRISVLLIQNILSVLSSNGATSIKYETLYGDKGTLEIKDIQLENIIYLSSQLITISDEYEEFSFTCFFDEVSAVFAAKKDCRELLVKSGFEGIIFDEKTPLVWEGSQYTLLRT